MDTQVRNAEGNYYRALVVTVIGLAHFAVPRVFDPINRLAFRDNPRTFTYINGAIETMMGVLMAVSRTRGILAFVSTGYVVYLVVNIIRTWTARRSHPDRAGGQSG
ncbi:hypothetical protein A5678_26115 [Mycobacterium sp. E2733]|nr:hypothetical protein A5678_26115 [Mycobacterium sp. E2733]